MYDLIICNGLVVDGTGKERFAADIAVKDGRIAKIGTLESTEAARVIDAKGRLVTPGFIDPHSHNDLSMLVWPKNEAYTLQGVTTLISGNCGQAPAPIADDLWEFWAWEFLCMEDVLKSLYAFYSFQVPKAPMVAALKRDYGLEVNWKTLGEFMDVAESRGFSCNYYPQSGHNHIRNAVMGMNFGPASPEDILKMQDILRDDLEHGSQGLSTGLDYMPGRFSDTAEIEALMRVVAEYGGVYSSHIRGFNPADPMKLDWLYGIREATELCRRTGVKTTISHMVPLFKYTPKGSPEMDQACVQASIAELERGWRDEGLPIMYDVIANTTIGGSVSPHLIYAMRPFVVMCGSAEAFLQRTAYMDFVQLIKEQVDGGKNMLLSPQPSLDLIPANIIRVVKCDEPKYIGKLLCEIMLEEGHAHIVDAVLALLRADLCTGIIMDTGISEESIAALLSSARAMPSSDGFAFDLDTTLDLPHPVNRTPHQNNFCYAIRYLLNYGGPRFEDKVRQMTGVPAEWFNLRDRGTLVEGNWADIVVIDLPNLRTNEDPFQTGKAPDGIDYVVINGVVAAEHKQHTGALAGKVLRRK